MNTPHPHDKYELGTDVILRSHQTGSGEDLRGRASLRGE